MPAKYKALIFAAGRGDRMRPLTDATPKPLLKVSGKALIVWQIEALVRAGFSDMVINHAWLGEQIEQELGDGKKWGAIIHYSHENEALETLGGIVKAAPMLGFEPFVSLSGDIFTDYDYAQLLPHCEQIAANVGKQVAHLVLVDNPPYHPAGDFALRNGLAALQGERLNFAGIAVWHPALFREFTAGQKMKLFPWAYQFIEAGRVSAEHHRGVWENMGTPQQLAELNEKLK